MRSFIAFVIFIGTAGVVDAIVYHGQYRREVLGEVTSQGQTMADDVRRWIAKKKCVEMLNCTVRFLHRPN